MVWALAIDIWMGIAPGASLAFAFRSGLRDSTRVALSAALSPAVVALCFAGLLQAGLPTRVAALAVAALGLPGAWWALRALRSQRPTIVPALAAMTALAVLWVVSHWLQTEGLRLFGWHNLMHLDAIQALLRAGGAPEEPELAGRPIGYGWLGLAAAAATSALAQRPATSGYPVANLLLLWASLQLVFDAARRIGIGRSSAAGAAALAVLVGHGLREIALLAGATPASLVPVYGDVRLNAPVSKFLYMDLMPLSIALVAAVLSSALDARSSGRPSAAVLPALCLVALAALYPAALPAGLALIGGLLVGELALASEDGRTPGFMALVVVAAVGIAIQLGMSLLGSGPAGHIEPVASIGWKAKNALVALSAPLLLAGLGLWLERRRMDPMAASLCFSVLILVVAYAALDVSGLEYKLVMYARIPLALLAAMGLAALGARWRGTRERLAPAALGIGVPLLLVGLSLAASLRSLGPTNLHLAPPTDETGPTLSLARESADAAWVASIAERTPEDTIVVADGVPFQLGVFANRSLWYPAAHSGQAVAGYGLDYRYNLVRVRGHTQELLARREQDLRRITGPSTRLHFGEALGHVRRLGRPVAVVSDAHHAAQIAERLDGAPAVPIYEGPDRTVWLVRASSSGGAKP